MKNLLTKLGLIKEKKAVLEKKVDAFANFAKHSDEFSENIKDTQLLIAKAQSHLYDAMLSNKEAQACNKLTLESLDEFEELVKAEAEKLNEVDGKSE